MNSLAGQVRGIQILQASSNFVFIYLWMLTANSAFSGQTFNIKRSHWGWSLENASYHQMEEKDYPSCLVNCVIDKRCKSLTYDLLGKKCKLSGETRLSRPLQYKGNMSNSIYMEMILTADRMQEIASEPPTTPQITTEQPTTPHTTTEPPTTLHTTNKPPTTLHTTNKPPTTPHTTNKPSTIPQTTNKPPTTLHNTNKPSTTPQTTNKPPTTLHTTNKPSTTPQTTNKPPTTLHTTNKPPTTPAFDPDTFCNGKDSGHYAHPTDCSKYASCAHGILYERDCGSTVLPNICGLC